MGAQSREIGGSDHSEVKILRKMKGDTVSTVEPRGAHWASLSLLLSEHEVIDDERAIGLSEEFAEAVRTGASPALRSGGPSSNS